MQKYQYFEWGSTLNLDGFKIIIFQYIIYEPFRYWKERSVKLDVNLWEIWQKFKCRRSASGPPAHFVEHKECPQCAGKWQSVCLLLVHLSPDDCTQHQKGLRMPMFLMLIFVTTLDLIKLWQNLLVPWEKHLRFTFYQQQYPYWNIQRNSGHERSWWNTCHCHEY